MHIPPGVHLPCQNNDPEDFYRVSDRADPRDPEIKYLAKICSSCVYIKECLSEELDLSPWEQHGFRAGLTAQQRARIIRKNRAKIILHILGEFGSIDSNDNHDVRNRQDSRPFRAALQHG